MNIHQFEFSTHYLTHIACNCFSNKYFEMSSPIIVVDLVNGKKQSTDEVKLLSIFQLEQDKVSRLYANPVFAKKQTSKRNPMELDPSKIAIWKEYFCRYDEGKREYMT